MLANYSVLDLAVGCGYDFQTSPGGSGDLVRSLPGTVVVEGRQSITPNRSCAVRAKNSPDRTYP